MQWKSTFPKEKARHHDTVFRRRNCETFLGGPCRYRTEKTFLLSGEAARGNTSRYGVHRELLASHSNGIARCRSFCLRRECTAGLHMRQQLHPKRRFICLVTHMVTQPNMILETISVIQYEMLTLASRLP